MSTKTNEGLVEYAKAQIGLPYWYGTFGQKATVELLEAKAKQYPSMFSKKRVDIAKANHIGKRVHDCVGLIKAYRWKANATAKPKYKETEDVNVSGMYASCEKRGGIASMPDVAGTLVFRNKSHVGVYIGGGYVVEAKGFDSGVCKTALKDGGWTNWGQPSWITYIGGEKKKPVEKKAPEAGQAVILDKAYIYSASTSTRPSNRVSGTFYLYDGKLICGRYRLTNKAKNANRKPALLFVTGWINAKDI